jgi:hypothetical protein
MDIILSLIPHNVTQIVLYIEIQYQSKLQKLSFTFSGYKELSQCEDFIKAANRFISLATNSSFSFSCSYKKKHNDLFMSFTKSFKNLNPNSLEQLFITFDDIFQDNPFTINNTILNNPNLTSEFVKLHEDLFKLDQTKQVDKLKQEENISKPIENIKVNFDNNTTLEDIIRINNTIVKFQLPANHVNVKWEDVINSKYQPYIEGCLEQTSTFKKNLSKNPNITTSIFEEHWKISWFILDDFWLNPNLTMDFILKYLNVDNPENIEKIAVNRFVYDDDLIFVVLRDLKDAYKNGK